MSSFTIIPFFSTCIYSQVIYNEVFLLSMQFLVHVHVHVVITHIHYDLSFNIVIYTWSYGVT